MCVFVPWWLRGGITLAPEDAPGGPHQTDDGAGRPGMPPLPWPPAFARSVQRLCFGGFRNVVAVIIPAPPGREAEHGADRGDHGTGGGGEDESVDKTPSLRRTHPAEARVASEGGSCGRWGCRMPRRGWRPPGRRRNRTSISLKKDSKLFREGVAFRRGSRLVSRSDKVFYVAFPASSLPRKTSLSLARLFVGHYTASGTPVQRLGMGC